MLSRLLDEQLDQVEHASIVDHVESCVCCQERLKDLTGNYSRLIEAEDFNRSLSDPWPTVDHEFLGKGGPLGDRASLLESMDFSPVRRPSDSEFPVIDGYRVMAELGHGGMGVVYKAYQERLSRFVALKMIRAGSLAKPEDLARFRIEAEAVAKQRHPNIIQIFDIGEVNGLPFVALELLEGGSLDASLAGRAQPGEACARLSATLARAIHAAHQAGIVHRDLKPSNVMFGQDRIPKITDFGLAKRLEEEGHTETGQVLGSPSYIPPEQAQGRAKDVGPAADVYALGAILYEMLTGRPPFKGATPVETVMQVLNEEPVPPSHLQPQVPRDLETICLKCLAKEPHKRYPTALALAEDLDRYLSDRPIQARRTPVLERGRKWVRRRPISSFLLAFCVCLLAIALMRAVRSEASYRAVRDRVDSGLTSAENEMIDRIYPIEELSKLETLSEADPRLADLHNRAVELLEKARHGRDQQLSVEEARDRLRAFVRLHDDALFQDTQLTGLDPSENVPGVREAARAALALYGAVDHRHSERWTLTPLHPSLSRPEREDVARGCFEMLMVLAEAVAQPLAGESATEQARQAVQILERAAAILQVPTHAFHLRMAACLERAGDTAGAARERAAALNCQPAGAFDHFLTGIELYKRGYMTPAGRHFGLALQAQPNHFWAQCLVAICELNSRHANLERARAYLTACLQTHPELPWLYLLRGFASGELAARASNPLDTTENLADAEADYQAALLRDPLGKFRYALLANRGLVRLHGHKLDLAIADLNDAIALDARQLSAHVTLAQLYRQRHQLDQALAELDRAVALKPNVAPLYRTRARWNLERPQISRELRAFALADLDRAITLGVSNSPEQAKDLAEKGRVLLLDKRFAEALDACDRALKIDPKVAEVDRYRVGALLELKRDQEAIDACDAYLRKGHASAELVGLRGLAKARRNQFAAAIDDYTLSLALEPSVAVCHARRGWAYLVAGAPQLALRDFEEAIRLDPSSGDSYSGRGSAFAALGRYQEAVADAEESLRHGESEARLYYAASRILALAATPTHASAPAHPRGSADPAGVHQQERALSLLGEALERTPAEGRALFWRNVVESDPAFETLRRLPIFVRIAAEIYPPRAAH
jgi:serine/threonine protein kinase/tetratricopeptide (TPR) repeat protein